MAKIFVADDEPDILLIIAERLRRSGHEVACASDGAQAVEKLEQALYSLIILDIRMPGYTGYEICMRTKGSEINKKTPVLLISAFSEEQTIWRQSKADAFLAKPFEIGQLTAAVDRLLKGAL